jgi:hypothetical protein
LVGAAIGDASATATVVSKGIDGGAGDDAVQNENAIQVFATSAADVAATTVGVLGYAGQEANVVAAADGTGIAGGAGDDRLISLGTVGVLSTTTVTLDSAAFTFGGATNAKGSTTATTQATGITGGDGEDGILSEAAITADAISTLTTSGNTTAVFGSAGSEQTSGAVTLSAGIDGGADGDIIENLANIDVSSTAYLTMSTSSFTLGGAVSQDSTLAALTHSAGVVGGAGGDSIRSAGVIDVESTSILTSSGTTTAIFGSAEANTTSGALTTAIGIDGGDGDDTILNLSTIDVTSGSIMTMDNSSFTFGGTGEAGATLAAMTTSKGISGGAGTDTIESWGAITVNATSSLWAQGSVDAAFGTSDAGGTSGAITDAIGIDGGDGDDTILNLSTIDVTSTSTVTMDNSSFTFGGTGEAGATLTATTHATGISGGSGTDTIQSEGAITVTASSSLSSKGNSDAAFGTADASGTSGAITEAIGIDGGEGVDSILSLSTIDVDSTATITLNSSSFSFGGTAAGEGTLSASTHSIGISGGGEDDIIQSEGAVNVQVKSSLTTSNNSDVAFGVSEAGATTTADTTGIGIAGGGGNDVILNKDAIIVGYYSTDITDAMAKIDVSGSSWTFGGKATTGAELIATGQSIGIDGGSGNDHIFSEGSMEVNNTSYANSSGSGYTFGGDTSVSGIVSATSTATGIAGGEGNDLISSTQAMTVRARSVGDSSGSSSTTFGGARASASTTAEATATGISAGKGNDGIENTGTIVVSSIAQANGYAGADTFWSSPHATTETSASAKAAGIDAGAGSNHIVNSGNIISVAEAVTTPTASADADINDTFSTVYATALSDVSGIIAGSGGTDVYNTGNITLDVLSIVNATAITDENADITAVAVSDAHGIMLGNGNNRVVNEGNIHANLSAGFLGSALNANASADSGLWDTDTNVVAIVASGVDGISTGLGDSEIINTGEVWVSARGDSNISTTSDSIDDAHADIDSDVYAQGTGIRAAGNGTVGVTNTGSVRVAATAINAWYGRADSGGDGFGEVNYYASMPSISVADATGISVGDAPSALVHNKNEAEIIVNTVATLSPRAWGDEKGIIGWNSDVRGAEVLTSAAGITLGSGDNQVYNDGSITVNLDGQVDARTHADSGNRSTHTFTHVKTEGSASGIVTGDGNNLVENNGDIGITADCKAWANKTDASFGNIESDAFANATAKASALATISATGIEAGSGENTIRSSASIHVDATADAYTNTYADDGGAAYDDWAYSYSYAYAYAYGIVAGLSGGSGSGNSNVIYNSGELTVESTSTAEAHAYARDFGLFDDSGYAYREANAGSYSYGILTGDADSQVINDGTINVTSTAFGDFGRTIAEAYGIKTGSGDDTIINNGTITTTELRNGVPSQGVGIDSGDGNDTVELLGGTSLSGSIILGHGDDYLVLTGSPVVSNGLIYAGTSGNPTSGYDTATFYGSGTFDAGLLSGFDKGLKTGIGTYTVPELPISTTTTPSPPKASIPPTFTLTATAVFCKSTARQPYQAILMW